MSKQQSRHILAAFLLLFGVFGAAAAPEREWVTLTDCKYVDGPDNDGDSFLVHCGDKDFTARLYYVDTPETNLKYAERTHEQSLHFGITLDETMKIGLKAKERVKELLQKPFALLTRWANAAGRGRESRYYVIVEVNEKSLAEILIAEGLARAKGVAAKLPSGEKSKDYMQRLEGLEAQAREKRVGAWSTAQKAEPEIKASPTASP
jgi:endonuclease YncB( thermonuclease family)